MVNINIMRYLDKSFVLILGILYFFKFLFFNQKKKTKKILIIRLWGMGDSINTLPLCDIMHKKKYIVDILTTTEMSSIFSNQKYVHKTYFLNYKNPFSLFFLILKLRKNKYEFILDTEQFMNTSTILGTVISPKNFIGFNHLFRSKFYTKTVVYSEKKHFVENFVKLSPWKVDIPDKLLPLSYKDSVSTKVDKYLSKYIHKKIIGIHLGTAGTATGRRWNPVKFKDLANKISKEIPNSVILFTGLDFEKEIYTKIEPDLNLKHELNLINKLSKDEFFYLFKSINLFISNDTGAMHIAAAQGCKVIGLFGMNNPIKVGPWPLNKNISLYKNPNTNPIINNKYSIYPKNSDSTIDLIEVKEVFKEVKKIFFKK